MIQLHIISKDEKQVDEIIKLLITHKLLTGVTVLNTRSSYENNEGKIETVPTHLIIGRTKSILFKKIEELLKKEYGGTMPVLYGMPIVNMDFKHMDKLKKVVLEK